MHGSCTLGGVIAQATLGATPAVHGLIGMDVCTVKCMGFVLGPVIVSGYIGSAWQCMA